MKFSLWVIFLLLFNYFSVYRCGYLFGQIADEFFTNHRRRQEGIAIMSALTEIMNLPCVGFDADGEETVNREAAKRRQSHTGIITGDLTICATLCALCAGAKGE